MQLIKPSIDFAFAFEAMVNDFTGNGELDYPKYYNREKDSFNDFIKRAKAMEDESNGNMVTETYWLVHNNNILGSIRYRKYLDEYTKIDGGNIGYDIKPCERGKGYGTAMLGLLLQIIDLNNVLITCELDNLASQRIVEKNGGQFECQMVSPRTNKVIKHYWIKRAS